MTPSRSQHHPDCPPGSCSGHTARRGELPPALPALYFPSPAVRRRGASRIGREGRGVGPDKVNLHKSA
jgi:hypothetical protein